RWPVSRAGRGGRVRDNVSSADYDVVIVGGGPAGCILANRLSANPAVRVLLLEAGGADHWWDLRIQLPLAMGFPVGHRTFDWRYESDPEPNLDGRRLPHPRGKVLGGSSSINGMLYERGHQASYDRWAAETGSPLWDYAHCEPYFRRLEGCAAGAARPGRGPDLRRVLRGGPAGRLQGRARHQRQRAGGLLPAGPGGPGWQAGLGGRRVPAPGG